MTYRLKCLWSGKKTHIRVDNHIFQIDALSTISINNHTFPTERWDMMLNYNGGACVCITFATRDEAYKAFDKIASTMGAK